MTRNGRGMTGIFHLISEMDIPVWLAFAQERQINIHIHPPKSEKHSVPAPHRSRVIPCSVFYYRLSIISLSGDGGWGRCGNGNCGVLAMPDVRGETGDEHHARNAQQRGELARQRGAD